MDNSEISKRFPYTEKDLECLAALEKMSDDEIDLSDIPEITDEEWETAMQRRFCKKKNLKVAG